MERILPGIPAGFGDWSVAGIFHESGRLMTKHFGDMLLVVLLVVLLFTFPASLIKVWHLQFHSHEPQGSGWNFVLYSVLDLASQLLFIFGFAVTIQVLIERIYPDGECSQSFFTTLKSAFRRKKAPITDSESGSLNEGPTTRDPFNENFLKGCGAVLLCVVLYIVVSTSGVNFTPEAVAEMGLPPWTVFVFTVLVAAIVAVSTSYLHLTGLLVYVWTRVPKTHPLVLTAKSVLR